MFRILFPMKAPPSLDIALDRLRDSSNSLESFSSEVVDFLDELSHELFKNARKSPALAPLAFFIRRARVRSLQAEFVRRLPRDTVAVPQGGVFHIPPVNVDTLFVYTLSMSLLAGNSNVIRISKNSGDDTTQLLTIIFGTLEKHPRVAEMVTFVEFDRDEVVLREFSKACNLRMLWGGDNSIREIREAKIEIHAKDLSFPDRISLAVINCDFWSELRPSDKQLVIERLYSDSFWFDQLACSSPQQLVFIAPDQGSRHQAQREVLDLLSVIANNKYEVQAFQATTKMVTVIQALGLGASEALWVSNSVVTVGSMNLLETASLRPGGGFFSVQSFPEITDIANQITRRVQTMTHLGFSDAQLKQLVATINGRGIDRIVPIGQALDFDEIWDGKDLLMEFHRLVSIRN